MPNRAGVVSGVWSSAAARFRHDRVGMASLVVVAGCGSCLLLSVVTLLLLLLRCRPHGHGPRPGGPRAHLLKLQCCAATAAAMGVFLRTALGGLVLLPFALRASGTAGFRQVARRWRPLLAFSIIELAGPWLLLGEAEQHLSSSLTGLLIAGVPLVGLLIAIGLRSDDRDGGAQRYAGLLLGLVGVGVLAFVGAALVAATAARDIIVLAAVAAGLRAGAAVLLVDLGGVVLAARVTHGTNLLP